MDCLCVVFDDHKGCMFGEGSGVPPLFVQVCQINVRELDFQATCV